MTDYNITKIGGTHKNISYEIKIKNTSHSFKEIDISALEKILEMAPKVTHNFNQYKANLNTLQTQVNTLQFVRRINSLKEYGISTLQILGYVALGLGTIYVMYKCKLFECLYRLIPKYIKILRIEWKRGESKYIRKEIDIRDAKPKVRPKPEGTD